MVFDPFVRDGWVTFPYCETRAKWCSVAHHIALGVQADQDMIKQWLQCQGTWFVGVEALATTQTGQIKQTPLDDALLQFIAKFQLAPMPPAQLSIMYQGYPKPRDGDSAAAAMYRRDRDAAHVDGLHAIGTPKRRFLKEAHAFVLGIPLNDADALASPMVIWEGSHHIMRAAFHAHLSNISIKDWSTTDLTETYLAARKTVFETCERKVVHVPVGAAYAIHPLMLHGVAPWQEGAQAPKAGRMIAYFRPEFENWAHWLA